MENTHFGPYFVGQVIGAGGMAAVYEAIDERSSQQVALKVVYPHLAAMPDVVRRFEREINVVSRLQHAHIVPVFDYGRVRDASYLAMKYMDGGSLGQILDEPREFSLQTVLELLGPVAGALDYAHSQGIIHRDIKPGNILLDKRGGIALADFGIAYVVDATRLTHSGGRFGTPLFMSPEQIQAREQLDHRVDIYAFAVLTYALTTGRYPFTGNDELVIMNQHVATNAFPPSLLNPNVTPEVDHVLRRGMAKEPDARYQTVTEFMTAIAAALATTDLNLKHPIDLDPFDVSQLHDPSTYPLADVASTDSVQTIDLPTAQIEDANAIAAAHNTPHRSRLHVPKYVALLVIVVMLVLAGTQLGGFAPTGAAEATDTPTPTPTHTASATQTNTPSLTPTSTSTRTRIATATSTVTIESLPYKSLNWTAAPPTIDSRTDEINDLLSTRSAPFTSATAESPSNGTSGDGNGTSGNGPSGGGDGTSNGGNGASTAGNGTADGGNGASEPPPEEEGGVVEEVVEEVIDVVDEILPPIIPPLGGGNGDGGLLPGLGL